MNEKNEKHSIYLAQGHGEVLFVNSPQRKRSQKIKTIISLFLSACLLLYVYADFTDKLDDIPVVIDVPALLGGTPTYKQRALRIMSNNPLIDGHDDLAITITRYYNNTIDTPRFRNKFENGNFQGQLDLPRINKGKYAGAFWSAFWICQKDIFDFSDKAYKPIVAATERQLDLLHALRKQYPTYFPVTRTPTEARSNFFKKHEHIAPFIIEGLHQIGNSPARLRRYFGRGVRYATLTWNCHNIYADAAVLSYPNGTSVPSTPYWGGISLKGRKLIKEMNRLGMIVDLAHVSKDTMRDILIGKHNPNYPPRGPGDADNTAGSEGEDDNDAATVKWTGSIAPPIFSHSSVYTICPHPRNVPDDIMELVKQRESIIMINFNPDFIACHYPPGADPKATLPVTDKEDATLDQVVKHIMYVGKKIGYDYVGIGSDFDGIEATPKGLDGVDKLPDLVAALLKEGVTRKQVIKIIGGNVLRVWDAVVDTAEALRAEGVLPLED